MNELSNSLVRLVTETSTNLPADVRRVVAAAAKKEAAGTQAAQALAIINRNIDMAKENVLPICQDTGMPTFHVMCPVGTNQMLIKDAIRNAVVEATSAGRLRPNSVDSITGKNSGNNLGPGMPGIHFDQWDKDEIEVILLLKGGGCENKNAQYSLPCELPNLGRANRDLDGVYKCIMHAVYAAQGQGCSAGMIGVCVGGDRTSSFAHAKEQFFRPLDDTNPNPVLAELEARVMSTADSLGIGTMGFGGNVTLMACKVDALNRLPASFFVSVAYNCWAFRRLGVKLDPRTGAIKEWMFRDANPAQMADAAGIPTTGREFHLTAPISEDDARKLHVGDVVMLSGPMHTGRDALHKYLMTHDAPCDLQGAVIYHCGPVMLKDETGEWHVKAAGPTTSIREEPYQADVLRKFGIRAIIGKGGMGPKTIEGLREVGAVYMNAIGGAAQYYAEKITKVDGVDYLEEFGVPEAMWHLQTNELVAVVTMDSHGGSLHAEVEANSLRKLGELAVAK